MSDVILINSPWMSKLNCLLLSSMILSRYGVSYDGPGDWGEYVRQGRSVRQSIWPLFLQNFWWQIHEKDWTKDSGTWNDYLETLKHKMLGVSFMHAFWCTDDAQWFWQTFEKDLLKTITTPFSKLHNVINFYHNLSFKSSTRSPI